MLCPTPLIELWQPDPDGRIVRQAGSLRRDGKTFTGWGRCATDAAGHYSFCTLTPGAPGGRAAFFALTVFARGLLNRVFTRAYLPHGDLAADRLLGALDAARRKTLICTAETGGYRFDIQLQGAHETVFLAYRGDAAMTNLLWPGDQRAGDLCPTRHCWRRWSRWNRPGWTHWSPPVWRPTSALALISPGW